MPPLYSHLYRVVQDVQGNAVPDVLGTITLAETGALAVLYADAEGLFPLPNPLVNNTQYGSFSVYLEAGTYNMSFVKASYVFEDLVDILIAEASGGVASLVGTPNQVLVSNATGDVVLSTPQNLDPDASVQFAHLGIGTPPEAGYGLAVQTVSIFRAQLSTVGITALGTVNAYAHLVMNRAGNDIVAFQTDVDAAGGTNRWALFTGGTAPSYLGGALTVVGAVSFSSTFNVASNMGVGGSLNVTGGLTVAGGGQINGPLGLGGAGVSGYSLTTYFSTQLAVNVTIGMVGTAATQALDVNGNIRARYALLADNGAMITGTVSATHLTASNNIQGFYCGLQGAPDGRFALRCYSTAYFDGAVGVGIVPAYTLDVNGYARFNLPVGIQTPPDPSWSLTTLGPILTYSNMQVNGTLYAGGALTAAATLYVVGQVTAAGNLNVGAGLVAATIYAATQLRSAGTLYVDGTSQLVGAVAVGNLTPGAEGYSFHVVGPVKMRDQLRIDGIASRPGGGPWTDSNSMQRYKTHIRPLEGALAQLLALQGRQWEWSPDYPELEARMPGTRTGLVIEEVEPVRPQWVIEPVPQEKALAIQGFEALAIEALREIVQRLEALEAARRTGDDSAS